VQGRTQFVSSILSNLNQQKKTQNKKQRKPAKLIWSVSIKRTKTQEIGNNIFISDLKKEIQKIQKYKKKQQNKTNKQTNNNKNKKQMCTITKR
jgi:hypothetical protein